MRKQVQHLERKPKITIGICTFRRHINLAKLLASISRLEVGSDITVSVVIVDNEPSPSAEHVVDAARTHVPWPLHYIHEPEPGIPFARNRILKEAGGEGFLALVDDDETVDPLWMKNLIAAQLKTQAHFVQGPVVMSVAKTNDEWWLGTAFFRQNSFEDLTQIKEAWTNNVLIDLKFITQTGILFEPLLRFEGGEDTLFFQDMVAKGGEGRFVNDAVVYEEQNQDRLTWSWGISRQYRYGITRAKTAILRRSKVAAVGYCFLRGGVMIGLGIFSLPRSLFNGRTGLVEGAALIARGAGVFAGYFGKGYDGYGR